MINFESNSKIKNLRIQFSQKIDAWNISVLEALLMLALCTSGIFSIVSILSIKSLNTIVFSIFAFAIFIIFKFVSSYFLKKNSSNISILSVIFWLLS